MMTALPASATTPDGRRYSQAVVGPYEITRLVFPPNHRHGAFEPERGYLVVVLDGAVAKTFSSDTATLSRDSVATVPAGGTHSSSFARRSTQVLTIRGTPDAPVPALGDLCSRRRHLHASASTALGWRMVGELQAGDASWPLALEGLTLQLLAAAGRASEPRTCATPWIRSVRDALHERVPAAPCLSELAAFVGHDPAHVARAFRRQYGQTIAQYARALRLDWAASQLALGDVPLARISVEAGFADQSHFTRAFRRHTGVPPGRYRELVRR